MIEAVGGWVLNHASNLAGLVVLAAAMGVFWHKKVKPVVDIITAQLRPNGGGSLLDKVNRIDPNHEEARGHWKTLEMADETLSQSLREINVRLARGERRFSRIEDKLDLPEEPPS